MFKNVSELSDVVSHFVYCTEDNTLLMASEGNEYWLPSTKIAPKQSWTMASAMEVKEIMGTPLPTDKVLRLYRIWVPNHTVPAVFHVIFQIRCNSDIKKKWKNSGGKYRGKLKWLAQNEIQRVANQQQLRSPELLELLSQFREPGTAEANNSSQILPTTEFINCGVIVEINEHTTLINPSANSSNMYEQLFAAAGYTKEVQYDLLRLFIVSCIPAVLMNCQVFSRIAVDLGWSKDDAGFLFRSADISDRSGVTFKEFANIIACVEPNLSHGGSSAELRCRYIFRFFDRDRDNILNYNEMKYLISAVNKSKKMPLDANTINRATDDAFKSMGLNNNSGANVTQFLKAVGELKFRGTSAIFRSNISILPYLADMRDRDKPTQTQSPMGKSAPYDAAYSKVPKTGSSRMSGDYEFAIHTIRLKKSGTVICVEDIWGIETAVTPSSIQQPTLNEATRNLSYNSFYAESVSNEVLRGLRHLAQVNHKKITSAVSAPKYAGGKRQFPPDLFQWGNLDSNVFGKLLIQICSQARDLIKQESKLLELNSPIYVLGDLHGNFGDLLYFEKVLWHFGPTLSPSTILFLGDFVDRGAFSMEIIAYLFSYKVQAPGKLKLIRGNHEVRTIQKSFTFEHECLCKFGESLGREIWNAVNNVFDVLPVAATIDSKIFCCHGGIPPPWLCPVISAINSIPNVLSEPEAQSALAWEIMWNDPVRYKGMTEAMSMELCANEGFAANTRRGTAHVFNKEALSRFLSVNNLSHVIRAHEVAQAGFNVQLQGRLMTVFSSSRYCGAQNEAACVVADQNRLRILRLET